VTEGAVVNDGTAIWTVRKFSGMSGTIAVSDNTGVNTGAATNVNTNGATVLPLPASLIANVTGDLTGNADTATKVKSKTILTVNSFSNGILNLSTLS
jgi:hypothetical protein